MSEIISDLGEPLLHLQVASQQDSLPSPEQFESWVKAVLSQFEGQAELTIRIVDEQEGTELNEQYRKRQGPTNVLSFPFEAPDGVELNWLGDLVICAPVVRREALEQSKEELAHWTHLVIHGVLHLLGYDHIDTAEALEMERCEVELLSGLGIPDPYKEIEK